MNIRTNRVKILLSINIIIFSLCALSCIRRIENDQLVENDQPSENNVVIKDDTLKGKSLESKFLELKELHKELDAHFKELHEELKKYANYCVWIPERNHYEKTTRVGLKLNGLQNYYTNCECKYGLLPEELCELSLLQRNHLTFEENISDENYRNKLNLCYNYQIKEQQLVDILLKLHDVLDELKSEIDFVETDIKLKKLSDSQLIERIDKVFHKYSKSNFEFNNVTATPNISCIFLVILNY